MPLVPCRACEYQVDTSALACPQCGATDPAKKISRQQRDFRSLIVQLVVWLCLLSFAGWYIWHVVIPFVKPFIVKTQAEPSEHQ